MFDEVGVALKLYDLHFRDGRVVWFCEKKISVIETFINVLKIACKIIS